MTNNTLRGGCPAPFYQDVFFSDGGYTEGRLCQRVGEIRCCFPCPMSDWAYPESFNTLGTAAEWVAVASMLCCIFLLSSWAFLPVDKTSRHYLSISLTTAILLMNLGFVVPLVGQPEQCFDAITPHSMSTNNVCAASGTLLLLGGWSAVSWVFLRSLSLHLQICWQLVVGRNFMCISQAIGWGIPVLGIIVALVFSGVSFRFGATCHINHKNSLADLWMPLLVFAGLTIIIQFSTFGYCIKVYLASLADNNESTDTTGLPSYTTSIRTMSPKQAYRRVRRVIQLQWRGIAIVLIIIADVIFFSVVFVFLDNVYEQAKNDANVAHDWVLCLAANADTPDKCLDRASNLVVNLPTVGAVLILLAMNGFWLICLLGRWSMFLGWYDLCVSGRRSPKEFVSVDARIDDLKKDSSRSYEMLSAGDDAVTRPAARPLSPAVASLVVSPVTTPGPMRSPSTREGTPDGWQTPDYFGTRSSRYHAPARSFSKPRPPQHVTWEAKETHAAPVPEEEEWYVNPLKMNKI